MKTSIIPDIVVTNVVDTVRLLDSPIGINVTMTDRKQWGLVLKSQGRTIYTADGRQILSDSQHPVILSKGCTYSWICQEPGLCQVIQFDAIGTDKTLYSMEIADNSRLLNRLTGAPRLWQSRQLPDKWNADSFYTAHSSQR